MTRTVSKDLHKAAVARYHSLLHDTPGLIDRTRDQLQSRLDEVKLVFGGRMLCPYLRPHFVSREQFNFATEVCERLWRSMLKVGDLAVGNAELLDYLGVTEIERKLISFEPGYKGVSRTSRLDSFLTDSSFQFVELNAETPAGIAYSDEASQIFQGLEAMKRLKEQFRLTPLTGRQEMLEVLLSAYREFSNGSSAKPGIAIVDYRGLPTQREFELFKAYFESKGFPTTIVDPRDLEFSNGKLRHGDFVIDVIYKRVLVNEFLEKIDECQALLKACEAGAVCMVNSFRGKLIHKKLLFGVLTDERFEEYFDAAEREFIARHVPWTRRVEDRKTIHEGRPIDLLEFIRKNRDNLVLKPNDEYGGKGIFVGWQCDANQWEEALKSSIGADYLVQWRVGTAREEFPYISQDGSVAFADQLVDLDPLLFDGKVGSAFTRLSVSELANVTAGGGMVPVFIVEESL